MIIAIQDAVAGRRSVPHRSAAVVSEGTATVLLELQAVRLSLETYLSLFEKEVRMWRGLKR